jgi:hypothetical protein
MFSLKFDLLFPTIQAAKRLARSLNEPPISHADPREFKRMQVELRLAREKIKAEALLLTRRTL